MGTGASKKPKVENKQLKPARSKLMAAVALAKPGAVPAPGMQKKTTIETLWKEPRHERGKWKELLEKNLVDFEAVPLDKNMVNTLLRGKTLQTKASDIRIIRVFISSTFTDTAQERNLLIADVYPYLKLFGRKYGFEFASSEMRWGIREESSSDHMTSVICMAEIARCQRESQGINYVAFLGDKYGFRPFPSRIEASEFEQLQAQAEKDNDPDVNLLSEWFDLNTNLVPHTYMLRPSSQAQQGKWWDIFEKLQMTLRKASRCLKDKERAKWYTVSVTEEEVHRGLLCMDDRDQKTFCYRRKIIDLENNYQDKPAGKFIDKKYSDGTIDSEAQEFLHKLKDEKVPGTLNPSNIKDYTVNWGPGITLEQHADYLREFGDHFCDLIVQSMTEAIKGGHVADDVLFEEVKSHAVFCMEKAAQVYGKDDILEKVSSYLTSDSSTPLVIHGPSGSGKTSIMAKAIANAVASCSDAVIIYRFLGTSMDSTAARPLLRSLCIQLRRIYGKDPNEVANDFKTLCEEFIQNLKLATNGQPLFLFLDSLDQMTDEDNRRNLEWLPCELPSRNVKIVVSTLPEEGGCLNKLQLSLPEEGLVEVAKMSANDGKELLESWLKDSNRSLTASQMLEVLDAFNECPYPLFLKIAFETSCTWTSFTPVDDITLSRTVRQLIDDMFDRLIRIHGNLLVNHALGYLTVAKFGLTANELEDILSCDDEVLNDVYQWWEPPVRRLPPLLWVRIQTDLGPYLVERGLKRGTPVLSWYHRQFREAAEERFVSDPEVRKKRHGAIAEYFIGRWAGQTLPYVGKDGLSRTADRKVASQPLVLNQTSSSDTSSKTRQYNTRKLTELPTALIGAERWQLFLECVCCIPFIEAKCNVGLVYELINEIKQASSLARSHGHQQVALSFKEFAQMLSENVQVLDQYPECTLQQSANFPDSSAPAKAAQTYIASLTNKPHWLCHVNKPQELSAKVLSLNWGRFSGSQSIVFSPDGRHLCCGTKSETGRTYYLTVWDVETGALLMTVPSENKSYFRVLYSPDGSHVACGMSKAEVRILDSTTGAQVKSITNTSKEFKNSEVVHMDFSPDGKCLAAGYENRHIVIWDVENCEVVHSLVNEDSSSKCHESKITSLRYTPNGRYLWSVEEKGIHKTWDAQSNYQCLAKGICVAKWYDDDEGDKFEGEIPGGIFTGHYEMEFPEGNSGDASFPIRFWDDGTLSGEGSDKDGDYTIKGTYDLASGTMKFVQEQYIASAEYDLQFEFTPNTEVADGTCHIWGKYVIPTWAGTYKGTIDMTLREPYPEDPKEEGNLNRARSGDVSGDSRIAVTANDDCTLKIYSLQGKSQTPALMHQGLGLRFPCKDLTLDEKEVSSGRRRPVGLGKMVTWIRYSTQGGDPQDVRFHPNNPDVVYGCSAHGSVCGFSVSTRKQIAEYVHGSVIQTLAISYDGARLVSLCDGDNIDVLVWDTTSTGAGEQSLHGGDTKAMEIAALEFSHDGSKLAAVIDNCDYVQVLETESGKLLTSIKFYTSRDNCCFSPDDSQLVVSKGRNLVTFNVQNGKEVDRFKNIYGYETGRACFSPQGQLAVQGLDQRYARSKIKIFTYPDKQLVQQFDDLSDNNTVIPCVVFSKDGSKLYSVGSEKHNNFIVVLCMKTGSVLQTIKPPTGFGRFCLDVSGTKCIIGSWDGNVSVFELETGKNLLEIKPQSWRINGISSFQIDGHDFVVSGCEDRSFKILDMKTGLQLAHMTSPQGVSAAAATTIPGTDRTYVALGDQGSFVRILRWM